MAGLKDHKRVYRGKRTRFWEGGNNYSYPYKEGEEVIHPSDVSDEHIYPEDCPFTTALILKTYIAAGCGLATLITETLLIHPFTVLKRQCQVNPGSTKYHIIPFTLVPVIMRLHQTQGLGTLWKGVGSVLLVKGMMLAIEDFIYKITLWPKEITRNSSLKEFVQHVLLKCVSIGLATPFFSASLVETVQSEIASEKPGILDVFRDGAIRLVDVSNKGRLISVYALLPPTIAYEVCKYLFNLTVLRITSHSMQSRKKYTQELQGAYSKDLLSEEAILDIELQSGLVSMFITDVLFYPWETVIHRLHLQGTRTIIDNLDTGRSVTPLLTGYSGTWDCYHTIIFTEGPFGFYKGFGAYLFAFTMEIILARAIKWFGVKLITILSSASKSTRKPSH
ncbi:mitochondrial outer membrane protein SLC25A46 [Ptiloglossa arizonensis]|uniref:mitochondrial outer membrane protein SLC25A46 n=1 Tax=Ptiloglossa arizonensis TaxID=3350558 RepID=UPI003FA14229